MSGLVPGANVAVMLTWPDELLDEEKYKRLSMLVSCCSMTCVTEFCTVCAEAPGKLAETVTAGGAIVGYCAIGSVRTDRNPATMMTMAMTQAKMGRSMKKRAMAG